MKMAIVLVSLFISLLFSSNIECQKSSNGYKCSDGDLEVELFLMEEKWPVKLDSGLKVRFVVDSQRVECFKDSRKNEIECALKIDGKGWHIFSKNADKIDKTTIKDIIDSFTTKKKLSNFNPPVPKAKSSKKALNLSDINGLLKGDIDGDGELEIVAWHKFAQKELGDFYQLLVYSLDGELLWSGPKVTDSDNSYIFGEWDFGISMPEVLIDIDKDNSAELLAPAPQSDVSVQFYRVFKWNGKRFVNQKPAGLILDRDNHFIWANPIPQNYSRVWVSELMPIDSKDSAKARVIYLKNGAEVEDGLAILKFKRGGADVVKWIKSIKLKKNRKTDRSYIAKISSKDHFNSRGVRLKSIRAILHQDRANYYKGKRDPQDSGVGYFDTIKKRAKIDNMQINPKNIDLEELKDLVIYSNPLLRVTIKSNSLEIEVLKK